MGTAEMVAIGLFILGGLFTILWFLLRQKDANQGKDIDTLFALHRNNEKEINELKLQIAKNYHPKEEINAMLDRFKAYLDERFDRLEKTFTGGK